MYWLPGIFIVTNIIFIFSLEKIIGFFNSEYLYKKYEDVDLQRYVKKKYDKFPSVYLFVAFTLAVEMVFCVIGLFHPIWMITGFIILRELSVFLYRKINPIKISVIIKRANLDNFQSTNIKFQRLLKINELKPAKANTWILYIFPMIKIILWASIIILHYNYNYFL